jgi:hypothetical protein
MNSNESSENSQRKLDEERRKLEEENEVEHQKKMEELDEVIRQLEGRKDEIVKQGCERLQSLKQQREDMREQLQLAASSQNETITTYKAGLVDQMAVHKQKLADLQKHLVEERRGLSHKQGYVHQLRQKIGRDDDLHRNEMQTFKSLIAEAEATISRLEKKHMVIKEKYKNEANAKVHAHKQEKNALLKKIELVEATSRKNTNDFNNRKDALLKQKKQLEKELEDELDKKSALTPLRKEKEKLTKQLRKKLDRIRAIRNKDEEDTEKMIQGYEKKFADTQNKFDKDRDKMEAEIFEKECQIQDKELLLDKLRADNTHQLAVFEHQLEQQLRDRETELQDKEEQNRKELQRMEDKDDIKDLEDQVHQKTMDVQNQEANQQAEENLLRVWLDAVTDRENYLREELKAKEARYNTKITSIENELNAAKTQAETEQRQHEVIKEDMEKKLEEKRDQFENQTREAAARLNAINTQIAELKRSLLKRQEEARDRGRDTETRIAEETKRLLRIKSSCEEQIEPLKVRHNELKARIVDEKDKHQKRLNGLRDDHQKQSKDLEAELTYLYEKIENVRGDFKKQRTELQAQLDDVIADNDEIREKHEKEIYDLNLQLVQKAMPQEAEKELMDAKSPLLLAKQVKDLQEEYAKKSKAYQAALTQSQEEKYEIRKKNDKEIQKVFTEIKELNKQFLRESGRSPEDLEKMKDMLETKMEELNQAKALAFSGQDNKSKLKAQIDDAKKRHSNLQDDLKQAKEDLLELDTKKNQEIHLLLMKLESENLDADSDDCSNPIQHRVRQLRSAMKKDLEERAKLLANIEKQEQDSRDD